MSFPPARSSAPDPSAAAAVLEAALTALEGGPRVALPEPPEPWLAWLTSAVPPPDAPRIPDVCDPSGEPIGGHPPRLYARVAALLTPNDLAAAVAGLDTPDGIALAVRAGTTDLLEPTDLARALELITDLATRGDIATAARAAAALPLASDLPEDLLPALASTTLDVVPLDPPPEPTEPEDAEVIADAEVVEPDEVALAEVDAEPEEFDEVVLAEGDDPAAALESDRAVPIGDVVESAEPEPADVIEVDVEPDQVEPVEPEIAEDEAPEVFESTIEVGLSLEAFAASLKRAAPPPEESEAEPAPVVEEQEVGMSLEEFEASLRGEPAPATPEPTTVEELEVGMSLEEFEASLKRDKEH